MPRPRLAMTSPWKIWTRSLSPSLIRTWTLTVSPTAKGVEVLLHVLVFDHLHQVHVCSFPCEARSRSWRSSVGQGLRVEEVGPPLARLLQRLAAPPFVDLLVVPREQDLGDRHPPEFAGPGVVGIIQPPLDERVVADRGFLADDAGDEPRHGVDHDHGRDLPAGQDVVADRDLVRGQVLGHPLVHALVPAADQDDLRVARPSPRPAGRRSAGPGARGDRRARPPAGRPRRRRRRAPA